MGYVHIIRDFYSQPEGYPRTVRIYTPDAYDQRPHERFGVVYMQDGQNVFAHPDSARLDTWCANWALERNVHEGRHPPYILVGVDHGLNRFEEYSPWDEPRLGVSGKGDQYVRFLADNLKPWIDRIYRTLPGPQHTAVMGSSLGGLISLYAGYKRPEVFGRIGGVSPTVMWSVSRLFDAWQQHSGRWSRIYLDVGEHERIHQAHVPLDYADAVQDFYRQLQAAGYKPHELRLVVEPGGGHHETDWQRRLPEIFGWLLAG